MHFFLWLLFILLIIIHFLIIFFFKILHLNVTILMLILDLRIKIIFLFNNIRVNDNWWMLFCRSLFFLRIKYLVYKFRLLSLINHFLQSFFQYFIFRRKFSYKIAIQFLINNKIFILSFCFIYEIIWLKRWIVALFFLELVFNLISSSLLI
jgi:hypothetical protein